MDRKLLGCMKRETESLNTFIIEEQPIWNKQKETGFLFLREVTFANDPLSTDSTFSVHGLIILSAVCYTAV